MLHVHVRAEADGHPLDADRYRAAIDVVRRKHGGRMVIQVTTEAVGRYVPAEQWQWCACSMPRPCRWRSAS